MHRRTIKWHHRIVLYPVWRGAPPSTPAKRQAHRIWTLFISLVPIAGICIASLSSPLQAGTAPATQWPKQPIIIPPKYFRALRTNLQAIDQGNAKVDGRAHLLRALQIIRRIERSGPQASNHDGQSNTKTNRDASAELIRAKQRIWKLVDNKPSDLVKILWTSSDSTLGLEDGLADGDLATKYDSPSRAVASFIGADNMGVDHAVETTLNMLLEKDITALVKQTKALSSLPEKAQDEVYDALLLSKVLSGKPRVALELLKDLQTVSRPDKRLSKTIGNRLTLLEARLKKSDAGLSEFADRFGIGMSINVGAGTDPAHAPESDRLQSDLPQPDIAFAEALKYLKANPIPFLKP